LWHAIDIKDQFSLQHAPHTTPYWETTSQTQLRAVRSCSV
jgi:hypothetical protein